ncbi:MAG: hypothetical protein ABIR06_00145 [Cyclobacteriaceae bacterium]
MVASVVTVKPTLRASLRSAVTPYRDMAMKQIPRQVRRASKMN